MSAEANIKAIQTIYAAFGRGDVPAILEMLAEDVKWRLQSGSKAGAAVPWYESLNGRNNVPKFFAALGANADFTKFEPHAFVGDGEARRLRSLTDDLQAQRQEDHAARNAPLFVQERTHRRVGQHGLRPHERSRAEREIALRRACRPGIRSDRSC